MDRLSEEQIETALEGLDGWETEDDFIVKEYEFEDFQSALAFVNQIGQLAEEADHHPDINFGWGYAVIAMMTHDVEGLTQRDFDLAKKIDALGK